VRNGVAHEILNRHDQHVPDIIHRSSDLNTLQ
jgi:hypothetical protein